MNSSNTNTELAYYQHRLELPNETVERNITQHSSINSQNKELEDEEEGFFCEIGEMRV